MVEFTEMQVAELW